MNSRESSWNLAHLVGCFLHSCWSSLAPLQLPQKVQTSSSAMNVHKNKLKLEDNKFCHGNPKGSSPNGMYNCAMIKKMEKIMSG